MEEEPFFFDEDAELGDYMQDDEFMGGPSPPEEEEEAMTMTMLAMGHGELERISKETTAAMANDVDDYEMDKDDMDMDDSTQQFVAKTITGNTLEDVNESNASSITAAAAVTPAAGTDAMGQTQAEVSVEEYLAARQRDHQLFNFERYTKGADWRTVSSSSNPQGQTKRGGKTSKNSTLVSPSSQSRNASSAAADAQFLDLLQWRNNKQCGRVMPILPKANRRSSKLLKTPKLGVETVPMTLSDESRVFVRRRCAAESTQANSGSGSSSAFQSSRTLGTSMQELKRRITNMKNRIRIRQQLYPNVDESNVDSGGNGMVGTGELWVDKHAPLSFPQLLSEERTNREVLRALRAWDPYVFGRQQPVRPSTALYTSGGQRQQSKISTDENKENGATAGTGNPNDKRPPENCRVIMLSGPPGVGKTTLAHIVARHAGYRPLEVNASDDRSASVLTERIQRAMESTTLNLASDKRKGGAPNDQGKPNCLILDEIDGADAKGAIQALADIIKAEIPPKNSKQKSKSTVPYLRRPIICICNHKYAPALRPLLPYAVHFNVEPPSSARLVARLKTILNKEKVSMMAGGSLLHQLVVSTGGDIRSCLFTLQFAAAESRSDKDLSQSLMNSLNGSGLKDDRNDITSTITGVFRKVKSSAFESTTSKMVLSKGNAGVARVMHAVEGFADDTTAINVLFMNVLRVSYIDPAFDRCSAAHELLSGADMSLGSEYSMLRVNTQPVAAGIHLLCRVEVKPKLTFSSREMADSRYQQDANMALVQKFSEGLPVKASNFKCRDLLAKEFIPMVLWILSAGEGASSLSRPASSIDILTKAERGVADRHVSILCALGLSYTPDLEKETNAAKSSFRNDAIAMQLEPPIHRLVHYQCLWNNLRRKEIPANMKMLLAQEVRLESFRYKENEALPPGGKHKEPDSNSVIVLEATKRKVSNETETKIVNADSKGNPRKSNELEASATLPEAKRIKSSPVTAGNFLGIAARKGKEAKSARRRAAALGVSSRRKLSHTGSGLQLNEVVRMKYVKGFTQAVRTPCRLQDLE